MIVIIRIVLSFQEYQIGGIEINSLFYDWVTGFNLMYSKNGVMWDYYKASGDDKPVCNFGVHSAFGAIKIPYR